MNHGDGEAQRDRMNRIYGMDVEDSPGQTIEKEKGTGFAA